MALSIFTSGAAMSSTNALNKSNSILSTAMERLGTGKRINSAADDAAGLQIATRLQGQVNGMSVAQRNISDATAMLQTGEGAFEEVTNIMYRMKDLATQAANDTNNTNDRDAMQAEFSALTSELNNIWDNTDFAGTKLFGDEGLGKTAGLNFQIGTSSKETINTSGMASAISDLGKIITGSGLAGVPGASGVPATPAISGLGQLTLATSSASAASVITALENTINSVAGVRSGMGAMINRLGHTAANLSNMQDNTTLALGNIRDADFASEATNMTRNQMLAQTSMSMLKQANSMSGMVMSLLG
ncbi:flagellin [Buttiauxella sp. BIGb0552]|uniref:flagellin N-terminal helical domain-containing protein n=1 Tax=Buttiauxella sp. BIGb0552 TaxID=2485120 RepID=UPI0010667943|nr:flagellin [Buttiauxella sp. BIGb0552]TDX17591.1 flagellin [Buttiauxella sp. BIGb0552]